MFYAARRRLGEKEPFLWYYDGPWHLFVEDGIFQCRERFSLVFRRRVLYTLHNVFPLNLLGRETNSLLYIPHLVET